MNRLLELEKELARFSGKGAKPNTPATPVSGAQSYHQPEPQIRIVNAMSNFPFDPEKLFSISYTVKEGDTLESIVGAHYAGMAPEEVSKAIAYHRKRLNIKGGPLAAGSQITVFMQASTSFVEVIAYRFLDRAEMLRRMGMLMSGIYNAQTSALSRLAAIIWWPKDASHKQKDYLLDILKYVIKTACSEVKGALPKAIQAPIDLVLTVFEEEIQETMTSFVKAAPKVSEADFEFVSQARSRLDQLNINMPGIIKAVTDKYLDAQQNCINSDERTLLSDKMSASLDMLTERLCNGFRCFIQLWDEMVRQLYKEAHIKIDLRGVSGPGDLGYCGFSGIPEDKINLVNREFNEVFRQLKTGYIGYHEMNVPVKIYVNSLGPVHISGGKILLKDHAVVSSYLNPSDPKKDKCGKDEANVVYFFPYKLYNEWGGVTTQDDYRLPFPAKFTVY